MSSNHSHEGHSHHGEQSAKKLIWSMAITLVFVLGEALAGYFSKSLALMSDAGHNLADALALGVSFYALVIARRPATSIRTFGYHRFGILAAVFNSATLVCISVGIFWEAVSRLRNPAPVESGLMIVVASIAVIINGLITFWLHNEAKDDLNIRSAYIHMLGDALSAVGVVIAGIVIRLTGSPQADPIASLLIGAFILWSSWKIMKDAVEVLLDTVPEGISLLELENSLKNLNGVIGVHDLHVWTVASGMIACSCHIAVAEQTIRSGQQVLREAANMLKKTIELTILPFK